MERGLGRRGEYAVRLALELARRWPGGRAKARELAEVTGTPAPYAAHVLADLVRAGLVASTAGRAGGYEVARDPGAISLLEVVAAVGVELDTGRCVLSGGPCTPHTPCAVHDSWHDAQRAFALRLAAADLASLIRDEEGIPS